MSRNGRVHAAWVGHRRSVISTAVPSLHRLAFDFDAFSFTPVPASNANAHDWVASAGTSDAGVDATSWTNRGNANGLHAQLLGSADQIIRECDIDYCISRMNAWLSAVSARSEDGYVAIAFAYDEDMFDTDPRKNIALLIFGPDGQLLTQDSRNGPDINDPTQWVNNPFQEDPTSELDTDQRSPSVSFVGNDVVVAWVGPATQECFDGANHIYARRFKFDAGAQAGQKLRDPLPASGEGRAGMFVVDTDSDATVHAVQPSPAVALTLATDNRAGRFIVAWNARIESPTREEVRAQFFDSHGQPRGGPFRVNQATGPTDPVNGHNIRRLDRSAAHTVAYGADDQVVAVWLPYVGPQFGPGPQGVYYTLLPPDYARTTIPACGDCEMNPELCDPCLKGDVNDDCLVNLFDIPLFVDALLFGDFTCSDILDVCRHDTNSDGAFNGLDIQCFVNALIGEQCTPPTLRIIDCNVNGIPDDEDIAAQTSSDVNSNGVPDECEPDCNENDVPDDWDIVQATSYDCDTDGIPDECGEDCNENGIADVCDLNPSDPDGNSLVSADCNTNGYPDECEPDCNTNGVPDDCDMDPTDPDGDEWVSPDCNEDGYPDECNLSLPPPFGSSDCNTNGIPDECDIADCESDPACGDCNSNGIPDGCDIAAEISDDANTNGIPDECEGESLMGGGESMMSSGDDGDTGETPVPPDGGGGEGDTGETPMPPHEEAAWEAFYDWSIAQCWGPNCETGTDAQFAAMIEKLRELGLPTAAVGP